jgi:purine-cytosine permease-like protein
MWYDLIAGFIVVMLLAVAVWSVVNIADYIVRCREIRSTDSSINEALSKSAYTRQHLALTSGLANDAANDAYEHDREVAKHWH